MGNPGYRVKRDRADYGFVWFTNAFDISLDVTGIWQDIDLSPYVPAGATGAIVEVVNTGTGSTNSGVVRGKEDTRDYMSDPDVQELGSQRHRWQIVKIDGNRRIQGFIQSAAIDFKLLGYTLGPDPAYFTTPPDITPSTTGQWTTVDVSALVDADADGVVLFIDSISSQRRDYGIREVGSSFSTTSLELERFSNTMYLVGLNASHQFEAYIQTTNVKVYLVGQTKGSVVYYTDDIEVDDPEAGSWQQMDADDYNVPAEANGLIFRVENTDLLNPYRVSFRHGDSTDDWNGDIGNNTHLQAGVGLNDANVWGQFEERDTIPSLVNLEIGVFIAAYTRLVKMDVHADMDVLIRRADGTVRDTLDTDVANSGSITETDWQSLTVTYDFPGYTVVDETDYLEIDLFAEAASNNWDEDVSIDFRIDDPALPLEDQTAIQF